MSPNTLNYSSASTDSFVTIKITFAGGLFLLMTLRTPGNILPLLGIGAASHEAASKQPAMWELQDYKQIQGGAAAQQQLLNFYVLTALPLTADGTNGTVHDALLKIG